MITIYHNPRCSKSRECNVFLNSTGKEVTVINYMTDPFTTDQLKKIIRLLGIKPIELIRKNEAIWKEQFRNKEMTDLDVVAAMIAYPKLIERPIVVHGEKAVVARPLELVKSIL